MTNKISILKDLKNHLQTSFKESVKDVILFGSQALGKANKDSDYDILVVLKNDYTAKDENLIFDLCYDISLRHNIVIDTHIISEKELYSIKGKQPIFIKAIKSGIYA